MVLSRLYLHLWINKFLLVNDCLSCVVIVDCHAMSDRAHRPRGRLRRDFSAYLVLSVFLWIFTFSGTSFAFVMGEECDWTGSGLRGTRDVTPVYLRCSQGRVSWSYPGGALRVLLRLGSSGRDFRGCVKTAPGWAGAAVFLEGPRSLVRLIDPDDNRKRVRCFQSRGGSAALYVEATGSPAFPKQVAELLYDLEPLARHHRPAQECRPCLPEEMTHAFCTSDLVTRGIIRSVETEEDMEMSTVKVKVTKHLRHSAASEEGENEVSNGEEDDEVRLTVPSHCGAKHGSGEFVLMARRKLGELAITCAPRLEDWVDVVRAERESGSANCVLLS